MKNNHNSKSLKHLRAVLAFSLMRLPMRGRWRGKLAKWGGG